MNAIPLNDDVTINNFRLSYLKTIGILNTSAHGRGFGQPVDLAINADGHIYVLNRHARLARVGICNLDEEYLGEFGSYGHSNGQFWLATAIAIDSQQHVYVTDEYHHNITVFKSSGELISVWGEYGVNDGQLNGPSGIAIDFEDNIFVVDQNNCRVHKFTKEGRHLLQWGEPGSQEGQFNLPWGITVDSRGYVYVADWRNDRIQKFSSDGHFIASFGESGAGQGQLHRPAKPAVDSEGYVYVADWGNERVQVFSPAGDFQLTLRGQASLSKWAQEFLNVNPDENSTRNQSNLVPHLPPHINTPYLVSSQIESYFWGPTSVSLDRQNRLYVTESARHRIQIFEKQ